MIDRRTILKSGLAAVVAAFSRTPPAPAQEGLPAIVSVDVSPDGYGWTSMVRDPDGTFAVVDTGFHSYDGSISRRSADLGSKWAEGYQSGLVSWRTRYRDEDGVDYTGIATIDRDEWDRVVESAGIGRVSSRTIKMLTSSEEV